MRKQTKIVSVFGQISAIVADAMTAEGKVHRIDADNIPLTARYDDAGNEAHCALVLSATAERAFDQRVRDLRM